MLEEIGAVYAESEREHGFPAGACAVKAFILGVGCSLSHGWAERFAAEFLRQTGKNIADQPDIQFVYGVLRPEIHFLEDKEHE